MPAHTPPRCSVIPCLNYRDAPAAIDWLQNAFGFEKKVAYDGPDGTIAHAELRLGAGYVMLGSVKDDIFNWKPPAETGVSTQMIYVVVADADALFARAAAAGAEVVRPLQDTDYGSRDFSVRDPEGHIWNFGTYHPED
jgi:uncharacterized glyoxalase superfamily protein PhnB